VFDPVDPELSVVVVNYGSHEYLPQLIASLEVPCELIVVDNFHSASELARLREVLPEGTTLITQPNNGFSSGVNLGNLAARPDLPLLLANPDAYFDHGALRILLDTARSENLHVASPRILNPTTGKIWFDGGYLRPCTGEAVHVDYGQEPGPAVPVRVTSFVSGCLMLLSPEARSKLLPMREDLFMYFEDAEVSCAAVQQSLSQGVSQQALAFHYDGATSQDTTGGSSALVYYYQARNRLIASTVPSRYIRLLATPIPLMRGTARILLREHGRGAKLKALYAGTLKGALIALVSNG
jgi:GT2 family glycosyltransferase